MKKRKIAFTAVGVCLTAIIVKNLIFVEYKVEGVSMQPTYEEGRLLSINKLSLYFSSLKRFDVVVFQLPNSDDIYVKRVIGLPGDELHYKDDQLYVNGKAVNEPFLSPEDLDVTKQTGNFTLEDIIDKGTIPKGYIFVIGDNRIQSRDSRHFGLVKMDDVIGIVGNEE
ncbi:MULTISPECIES: signal peptidase I [Bacillaceae]|uniref:Signal peptidase I n=1 Tax=Metabacillus endolithicus TaxID=1535204 RepID=A0ABW5C1Z2_9BACI|nr:MULTISPECIES: signal peptidase I [Bacillaceae]MCM3161931.1 signal peptidase I [Metabacillus litoralis]MCM3411204.1 signal peptidase I [Metabacillus litoralis]PGT91392.1 signal peptidase I [Bacillus sp. AFS040349]UGB31731.1 signal peptidase I [Metabacillus sp. B2-18]UHA60331.1 signal peptidase I [Metabacillus litoralis]